MLLTSINLDGPSGLIRDWTVSRGEWTVSHHIWLKALPWKVMGKIVVLLWSVINPQASGSESCSEAHFSV